MAPESLGQRVRRDREAAGLTQRDLAGRLGIGIPHVSKVEADRERASDDLVQRIAVTLGQDPDEYMLVARRLPQWVADMFAERPGPWIAQLRRLNEPIETLIARSSLGTPAARAIAARTPPSVVAEVMRRVRTACATCAHPESWHLVGPETWAGCDADECECEMYQPKEEGGDA